ncbi:MAG: hypothetical protein JWM02_224 [Frankiales bacterium]|nr:hypothetical protein [Frankiales bacterium]
MRSTPSYDNRDMTEQLPWRRRQATPEPHLARLQQRMAKGESLEEAGAAYGLELWRAKAIFVRSGLPVPKPVRRRKPRDDESVALGRRIHTFLEQVDSARVSEVASALEVSNDQVRKAIWPQDKERILPTLSPEQRYPRSAVLIGLQAMSITRGRENNARGRVAVSAEYWDSHRDPQAHPTAAVVRLRFGSWRAACEAAGIPVHGGEKLANPRRWSDEECLAAVTEFFAGGHGWGSAAYDVWSRPREVPSVATVMLRLGSWPELRDRILS